MTAILNGRPRKQLSDQIDRLDRILDGLADGFQEIVAQAAEDGAKLGSEKAIQVLLNHPTLQSLVAQASLPAVQTVEMSRTLKIVDRLRQRLRQLRTLVGRLVQPMAQSLTNQKHRLGQACRTLNVGLQIAWGCRWNTASALLIGSFAAVLGYIAPPALAATLCGISGMSLTLICSTLTPLVTAVRRPA